MPSLCGSAEATREWFRAFADRSLSTCRPLGPRRVHRLHAPSSFADDAGLRPCPTGSTLSNTRHPLPAGNSFRGFPIRSFATTCRLVRLLGGSDRASSEGGYPLSFESLGGDPSSSTQPTETFTPELPTGRSPFPPSGMATVATGQFPQAGHPPARTAASIAATDKEVSTIRLLRRCVSWFWPPDPHADPRSW